ncbi:methyltransferase domain-containing protein [Streptomyces sp. A7024]|uniref:Methyltransferase domain-containing protein n=1 Tax=Streptomyces coryli TaxID=1128680 RepID=A0A6G4U161_9ACTN|nr:class I SAM-dependent methyltransferase [Streptomyces coryli]NGN65884.1 methyltransferase domain-containing protein [Streptomyces coryli]
MSTAQPTDPTEFWEDRYRATDRVWSGEPNPLLVREATDLKPGTALDLGCGEGADVLWLAARGWQVTGVDISATAIERAAAHAAEAGLTEQVAFERHELGVTFPEGSYDLVSAHFLQSPVALDQHGVLKRAAAAVAPGGTLLIVMHAGWATWQTPEERPVADVVFPTLQGFLDDLALPPGWHLETQDAVTRVSNAPDGRPGTRTDNVWRLTRR